jgi:hypothetical protein
LTNERPPVAKKYIGVVKASRFLCRYDVDDEPALIKSDSATTRRPNNWLKTPRQRHTCRFVISR